MFKTFSVDYERMLKDYWTLIEDLRGGSEAMRARRTTYLPQEAREKKGSYENRLARSFLDPFYEDTVDSIASKPFTKVVDVDSSFEIDDQNVDLEGTSITAFTKSLFLSGIDYGLQHVLVDHTPDQNEENLAEEIENEQRPYFVNIKPSNLTWWDYETINGAKVLTEIYIKECVVEGNKEIEQIRKWTRSDISVWRKNANGEEILHGEPRINSLGKIPLITGYFNKTGFMTAKPNLFKLGELNLEHYQVRSDHKNILRIAAIGILFGAGFTSKQVKSGITVGVSSAMLTENPDAKLKYVEYEGKAIDAIDTHASKLESRMEAIGHQPFVSDSRATTATRENIQHSQVSAPIQNWVREQESTIQQMYELAAEWEKVDAKVTVKINDSFVLATRTDKDLDHLRLLRKEGSLSKKTMLEQTRDRGILGDGFDVEEELERIESEFPELGVVDDDE